MSKNIQRVAKLETGLTPKQAILLWFQEAHGFNTIFEYIHHLKSQPDSAAPIPRLTDQVAEAVKQTLKGHTREEIDKAVRQAYKDVLFLFFLHQQVNRKLISEERYFWTQGRFLIAELKSLLREQALGRRMRWNQIRVGIETPYPLDSETAAAVEAAKQHYVMTWELLEEGDDLGQWLLESFLAKGNTALPDGAYGMMSGAKHLYSKVPTEDEVRPLFEDAESFQKFLDGEDYSYGLADVPDAEYDEHYEAVVLAAARGMPTWRSRQLAASLTDHRGLSVSASTVYRILRREGLVKRIEYQLAASKEYQHKTTGPHQLWATDASYFRVVGWGYYYLVTVMDDYSRFILAWKVQRDMTANSLIEVVQEAVDSTGMTDVPLEDRTKLLSDNGSGYVSRAFREYMRVVGIRHVLAAPYHPQTNGKLERYHRTLKDDINQVPYEVVEDLEAAIRDFVEFYNYRRYHQALRVVTPADVLEGRLEAILAQRKEVQRETFDRRRRYNQEVRETLKPGASSPQSLGPRTVQNR